VRAGRRGREEKKSNSLFLETIKTLLMLYGEKGESERRSEKENVKIYWRKE
jgi:hypothetical protein